MKPRRLRDRLRYLLLAPFEAAIALVAFISGAVYLVDPGSLDVSAVGRAAPAVALLWEGLYTAAGVMILSAILIRSLRMEVAGLSLFLAAVSIQAIAIIDVAGVRGAVSAATFLAIAGACVGRSWVLINQWKQWRRLRESEQR